MGDEINNRVTEEFQEMIKRWIKIDDEIRKINMELKELKEDKNQYEEYILKGIEQINKEMTINIDNGAGIIRRNVKQSKGPLKKEMIQNVIMTVTKDQGQAVKLTEMIFDSRPMKESVSLKRSTIRKK